ncbi:MAG TPA: hypothetical protein VE955_00305 [Candidatus Dormibacteraeota bacterium]|nr:hypothetical protein [Candidatus Dormibacteraeota bacterium]
MRRGYNEIASKYTASRVQDSKDIRLLEQLVKRLHKGAKVLDAGCGSAYLFLDT